MTAPRRVVPGAYVELSQRTLQRTFLFADDPEVRDFFLYALAEAAGHCRMRIYTAVLMATHFHIAALDREGRYPEFMQRLNMTLARGMNRYLGRRGQFWAREPVGVVTATTEGSILARYAYILANPVNAGIVRTPELYTNAWIGPDEIGTSRTMRRPARFFSVASKMPLKVRLVVAVPEEFGPISAEEARERVRGVLAAEISRIHRERKWPIAISETSAGQKLVRSGRTNRSRVSSFDVKGASPRRALSLERAYERRPLFVERDQEARRALVELHEAFQRAYQEARRLLCDGEEDVLFPFGTYRMKLVAHVSCCEPVSPIGSRSARSRAACPSSASV